MFISKSMRVLALSILLVPMASPAAMSAKSKYVLTKACLGASMYATLGLLFSLSHYKNHALNNMLSYSVFGAIFGGLLAYGQFDEKRVKCNQPITSPAFESALANQKADNLAIALQTKERETAAAKKAQEFRDAAKWMHHMQIKKK